MNKPDIVPEKWAFFKRVLPRWLVVLALGFQTAIVAVLFVLSILFTVTFKRANSQLGSITEQVDYHFGMPSIAFVLGTVMLCLACARLFEVATPLGFCCIVGIYDSTADHLAHFIEFGNVYISGFAESDGCCGCLA